MTQPPDIDPIPFFDHIAAAVARHHHDPRYPDTIAGPYVADVAHLLHELVNGDRARLSITPVTLRWLACGMEGIANGLHELADAAAANVHAALTFATGTATPHGGHVFVQFDPHDDAPATRADLEPPA